MKKITSKHLLILILALGFALRFTQLGKIPGGFSADEASQAYSAYSLLKTGRDEWGVRWPIFSFKSFLDYKAPLQTYLMIPSIAIFGLNEMAARFPSALFGVLSIYAIYRLTRILAINFLSDNHQLKPETIALTAAILLAISPWHIQFSRTALEANLVGFFILGGLWLFLEGLKDKRKIIISAVLFALSIYAYHSAKIFIPPFIGLIVWISVFRQRLTPQLRAFILFFALVAGPALLDIFLGKSATRGQDLLIFNLSPGEIQEISDARFYSPLFRLSPSLPAIFHNKLSFIFDRFVENYASYFNLSFWFTEGGREITYSIIPGRGLLYTWEVILFIAGFVFFTRHYTTKKLGWLLLGWFLLAALPAAITKEGYRPNRASAYLGLFELIMAFGASYLFMKMRQMRFVFLGGLVTIATVALAFYINDYAIASSIKYPTQMAFGWREAAAYLAANQDQYDQVYIQRSGQPQSFLAFYLQMSPKEFQGHSATWNTLVDNQKVDYLDQLDRYQLGRYTLKHLNFPEDIHPKSLYLVRLGDVNLPEKRKKLHVISNRPDKPLMEFFTFEADNL